MYYLSYSFLQFHVVRLFVTSKSRSVIPLRTSIKEQFRRYARFTFLPLLLASTAINLSFLRCPLLTVFHETLTKRFKFYSLSLLILWRARFHWRKAQSSPVDTNWTDRNNATIYRGTAGIFPRESIRNVPSMENRPRRCHCLMDDARWMKETRLICGSTWSNDPIFDICC